MPIKDKTGKGLTVQLPSLIGTQEFTPTGLMIKVLCVYLQALEKQEDKSALQILSSLGSSKQNYYNWLKKEGYTEWWDKAVADFHSNIGLAGVYNAIYRRAKGNSPTDAKLYLERFDKDYRPATVREHKIEPLKPPAEPQERLAWLQDQIDALDRAKAAPLALAVPVDCTQNSDNTYKTDLVEQNGDKVPSLTLQKAGAL